jgi:hypothetical protein
MSSTNNRSLQYGLLVIWFTEFIASTKEAIVRNTVLENCGDYFSLFIPSV